VLTPFISCSFIQHTSRHPYTTRPAARKPPVPRVALLRTTATNSGLDSASARHTLLPWLGSTPNHSKYPPSHTPNAHHDPFHRVLPFIPRACTESGCLLCCHSVGSLSTSSSPTLLRACSTQTAAFDDSHTDPRIGFTSISALRRSC
jgi:hypothetical protein